MKKSYQIILLTVFIIILAASTYAKGRFSDFNVGLNGSYPYLTWRMSSEDSVTGYVIQRSANALNYYDVASFNELEGAGKTYRYTDTNVFKQSTRSFYYRIRVLQSDGNHWHSEVQNIQVSQNGLRQTWGSIKALFR